MIVSAARNDDLVEAKMDSNPFQSHLRVRFTAAKGHNEERARAHEERKQNVMEYRQFLQSCDFIKASTQWRKVQERLEADERCSRLEKIDRLEIFQDYLHALEKEEEEQRKIQKEEIRKAERKNRDVFRKLLEQHVAVGTITAKTHWRDYYMKVKDLPTYLGVVLNSSGLSAKELFEVVAQELEMEKLKKLAEAGDVAKSEFLATVSYHCLTRDQDPNEWSLGDFRHAYCTPGSTNDMTPGVGFSPTSAIKSSAPLLHLPLQLSLTLSVPYEFLT